MKVLLPPPPAALQCSGAKVARTSATVAAVWVVVLMLLCCGVIGATAQPKGIETSKRPTGGASVCLVEERTLAIQKTHGPPGPAGDSRRDRSDSQQAPPEPAKVKQLSPYGGAAATTGTETGNPGRRLAQTDAGEPCAITIKNMCKSKRAFKVAFGYYTYSTANGRLAGWESQGWWTVKYGKAIKYVGFNRLYVKTTNNMKIYNSPVEPASFCVQGPPFSIIRANDGLFYIYDSRKDKYYYARGCDGIGGYWAGDFWAPPSCGMTIVYKIKC